MRIDLGQPALGFGNTEVRGGANSTAGRGHAWEGGWGLQLGIAGAHLHGCGPRPYDTRETKTIVYVGAFGIALCSVANAAAPPVLVDEKSVASGKLDIRPAYPAEAQSQRLTGSGVFILHINPASGSVRSVQVEKTTGHKVLDDASITAFQNLRFKPHGVLRVTIPITFEMAPDTGPRVTRNFPATWLAESQPRWVPSGKFVGRK